MFTYWLEFVWCLDRHHILRPKQIHSTKPSCQMFVKISHSLTGSLIIFDCTLFSSSLSIHFSVSYLANEAHCWFTFSPCHQSSGQHCWHWEWLEEKKKNKEQWQAWANNLSMIKAAEWKRTLCTMIGEGRGGGYCSETDHLDTKFLWHCSSWDGMETQSQSINHNYHTNVKPIHLLV